MIRVAALTLAVAMAASLTACGGSSDSSASSSTSTSSSSSLTVPEQVEIDYGMNLTEDGLWEGVAITDYVTLPEYKNITIPSDEVTPTEEDLEYQRQSFVQDFGTVTQITDRAVEDGDQVNIDYVGSVDGVEFTGGNTGGNGTTVTAGSENYIDDFLTQIIGHMPGETINVEVTFPDDYNDSTDADGNPVVLAGKDAVFVTTINYIEGETIYPEFDDAFVSENLKEQYGWETAAQANEEIQQTLTDYNKSQYLQNYLLENSKVSEVPAVVNETLLEQEVANLTNTAAVNGLPVEYLLMMYGYESLDSFRETFTTDAEDQIKLQLILQAIAEAEGLAVSDDDLKTELGEEYDTAVETYGAPYLKHRFMLNNGYNFVMENNTIG